MTYPRPLPERPEQGKITIYEYPGFSCYINIEGGISPELISNMRYHMQRAYSMYLLDRAQKQERIVQDRERQKLEGKPAEDPSPEKPEEVQDSPPEVEEKALDKEEEEEEEKIEKTLKIGNIFNGRQENK